jgi:dTDP-4-dehydrorhamnose 3,5-epimerase-like enzyme
MDELSTFQIAHAGPTIGTDSLGDDVRGFSFGPPAALFSQLGDVRDLHVMTIRPGRVRGNHYHVAKDEMFLVLHQDAWSLHWSAADGPTNSRAFAGSGGVTIVMPRMLGHAIRNDGAEDLFVVGASTMAFDPVDPDAIPMTVI